MAGKQGMLKKHTIESVKKKVEEMTSGEYSVVSNDYLGYHSTDLKFCHNTCGTEYETSLNNFSMGYRCGSCQRSASIGKALAARKRGFDIHWAKKLVEEHGNGEYALIIEEYKNVHTKVTFLHLSCGAKYEGTINKFKYGRRCPFCNRESRGEILTEKVLRDLDAKYEKQKTFAGLKRIRPLKFDFWLPEYNTAIEYDGRQHTDGIFHTAEVKLNDEIKNRFCQENGITLIRIPSRCQTAKAILKFLEEAASTTIP